MDERHFQEKLAELMDKVKNLPEVNQQRVRESAEKNQQRRERLHASMAELQESLDHLRLSVKYLVFDLEATKRENAYLRKLLEHQQRDDNADEQSDNFYEGGEEAGGD